VLCVDISHDSNILLSGSADKTIKIWGLDFGDCHRCRLTSLSSSLPCLTSSSSLLAHEDTVTCVKFQPLTHYFFSCGKDGAVKYWDADRSFLSLSSRALTPPSGSSKSSTSRTTSPRSGRSPSLQTAPTP
jgi:U3 small nucleolar RNA-associated protein 12